MIINKRLVTSGITIAAAGALLIGATFAYFNATDTSTNNHISTGTLDLNITDQNANTAFQSEALGTDWQPGETRLVNFDVKNTGTLPMNIRGFATGSWNFTPSLGDKVSVTKVERYNGGWQELGSGPFTGYFYYSQNGTDSELFTLNGGDKAQLQVSVKLAEDAGNEFQGKTFTVTIQAEGKQINTDVWP